jgi:acryloyl-coenzyme A reductase
MGVRARMIATGFETPLRVEPFEPPSPTSGQVLVEVEACGVCHRDLLDRAGRMAIQQLPITPGHEAVGRVVAVGPSVTRWRVGDRVATMHRDACLECERCAAGDTSLCERAAWVFGILADGGYASHLVAPESAFYAVPAELPAAEAAVYHCTLGTTLRRLRLGGIARGQTVLVAGANGGTGVSVVQVAHRLGATVIAQVRDARHAPLLRQLGADRVLVDRGDGFHKHPELSPVDIAVDCVGQTTFNSSLRSLRQGGRLIAVGNISPERVALNLGLVIVKGLSIIGSTAATPLDMAALFALGPFHMPIDAILPLARADEAQARVRAGGLRGRVVITPGR